LNKLLKYRLLEDLLPLLEEFENNSGKGDLKEFSEWLYNRQGLKSTPMLKAPLGHGETLESAISKYVIFMYRYARHHSKAALDGIDLQSLDDFSYLVMLMNGDSLSKKELIKRNLHEKSTGMAIIARLVQKGLLKETEDAEDSRITRVSLTKEGENVLFGSFQNMYKLSQVVSANLSESEKTELINILYKLDQFHNPLFHQAGDVSLDELVEKTKAQG
jgi:DNA-binding MarR family transcriptional regulator